MIGIFFSYFITAKLQNGHKITAYINICLLSELKDWEGIVLKLDEGTSLMVVWLRRHSSNAGGTGSIPGRGAKISHTV